ncbi:class I SAM-dependent RNA methyltransferase [Microbacterium sp. LRZ72]|uniref:class I SAM-dependent RNA methyltransferase n=1 Tax=Microbacterium sp. LRZ72 TaxID=2942481 RepID=UPI0029A674E4|nr:TRAM domain-containing protein [Microbacterium sp. LRZ72]MDX2376996.1 class I SAM-dependent RNA methyltransferase [Microbacterium sp. LRZ72]
MQPDDTIELDVTDVAHGGVFIARHEGRVVFVSDAVPGERVRARITDTGHASYWRAETIDVIEASPDRRPHVWPDADLSRPAGNRPGGADFGHIALAAQRSLKQRVLTDALSRFGQVRLDVEVEPAGAGETVDGTRWRTRIGLHVAADGSVGPVAARSHRVIPVASHPLAAAPIERAALSLAQEKPGRIDLVLPADGDVRVVRRPEAPARRSGRRPPRRVESGASDTITERALGHDFSVDAGGFWQVHRLAADTLGTAVVQMLREHGFDPVAPNLDLYGGVGLFAAAMGVAGGPDTHVTSVESAPGATLHATSNLAGLGSARAVTGRVDRFLRGAAGADEAGSFSGATVLLDPPRAGAGREVVRSIAALAPRIVLYVACDPVALARDVGTFGEAGYRVSAMRAFDLFPNAHHLEAIAVLEPNGR